MLASCSAALNPVTPPQVPVDLTGVVTTLLRAQPLIVMIHGRAFTQVQRRIMEADLNRAAAALAQLSIGMPAPRGAQLAREIDAAVNNTLGILAAAVPFDPRLAHWTPLIDAIDAVLPETELFAGVPITPRGRRVPAMTPDQGRQALGIRTVQQ